MWPMAVPRLTIATVAVAGLLAGAVAGWALKPVPAASPTATPVPGALIGDALATLDDLEKLSAGVVEILDDMIGGNVSRATLEGARDSMQEIVEGLGDVKSQIAQLRR